MMCQSLRAKCEASCSNKRSYGAIAYSVPDEGFGWSNGWDYQDQAEKTALANCSQNGTKCEIVVWFYNSCGAVAADGKIVTWGQDSNKGKAEQSALDECVKKGGSKCEMIVSRCSVD